MNRIIFHKKFVLNKVISFSFLLITLVGCKSYLYNKAYKSIGAFDEEVKLEIIRKADKEVAFLPMIHVSTDLYYKDVRNKIDSLEREGYHFYYEFVNNDNKEDTLQRKIRKILNLPFASDRDYLSVIDSLMKSKNIKLDKELFNQPEYEELGLNKANSQNVDASVEEIVAHFENLYGNIVLEPCDFENSPNEKSNCENLEFDEEKRESVVIDFRNKIVVDRILRQSKHDKITVIYGRAHIKGIKEALLDNGYAQ